MTAAAPERSPLEGYTEWTSYRPGDTVAVHCSSRFDSFSVEVARIGRERSPIWECHGLRGGWHEAPAGASSDGCDWPVSFRFAIPLDASSGYYEIALRGSEPGGGEHEHLAFFVVRPPGGGSGASILLVLATNTYNAYNDWGGQNLYTGGCRASFRRPMAPGFLKKPEPSVRYPNVEDREDPEHEHFREWAASSGLSRWSGSAGWHNWERVFVAWAEREGYEVATAASSDLEDPGVLEGHRLVVSVGHDEYWSWAMRDTLEAFIARGGNVAFLSGNAVFWQVRLEEEGTAMVCHKSVAADPLAATEHGGRLTTMWSAAAVGRPENQLTGVSFTRGGYVRMGRAVPRASGGYTVWRPEHWAFEGTGACYGDVIGAQARVVAYEVDGCELALSDEDGRPVPTGRDGTPREFTVLATAPARLWSRAELPARYAGEEQGDLEAAAEAVLGEASPENVARLSHNHAVMGTYTRGGTVFTAGTTEWVYGLAGGDPVIEQVTRNVLGRLS